jgi:[acyl-carrier-protein] S-malonyltransferase
LFEKAAEVLQYNLLKICLEGPERTLEETIHCQSAVVVASLAAVEQLKVDKPQIFEQCLGCAGFSVGEFTSLIFAKSITLEEGLTLVRARAKAMQAAAVGRPGSMATVVGLSKSHLSSLCREAELNTGGTVSIGNCLFETGFVISGDVSAVDHVKKTAALESEAQSIIDVHVSGAFHSQLMLPAVSDLNAALSTCRVSTPDMTVYSNVTGRPYSDANSVRTLLAQQLTSPVLWKECMEHILASNPDVSLVECGPGRQLKSILRRVNKSAFKRSLNLEV